MADVLVLDDGSGHQGFVTEALPDPSEAPDGQVPTTASGVYSLDTLPKDFYAQDADPGVVGAGSVWKDTTSNFWWERNVANDGWMARFAPNATAVEDEDADTAPHAAATGTGVANVAPTANSVNGAATAGPHAEASGNGNANARPEATTGGNGHARSGPIATSTGSGDADVRPMATATGGGDALAGATANAVDAAATAGPTATATGTGDAVVFAQATAADGAAYAGSLATRQGVTAGMDAVVDGTSARMAFNGTNPIARPELPATPTEQDIADVLVALGLVTQAV